MSRPKTAAAAFALSRLAFGAGLVVRPDLVASGWLGKDARRPSTQVAVRGLGARDIALSAGTLAVLGDDSVLPLSLAATVFSDLADLAATLAAPAGTLPPGARWGTVALAGAAAAAGTALIAALRR